MGKTKIEWARNADGSGGSTWNPIRARNRETGQVGTWCQKISPGCTHCYAETHNLRNLPHGSSGLPYTAKAAGLAEPFLDPKMLAAPLLKGTPETYFVCSLTDLFGEWVPDSQIDAVLAVAALTPQHTYQLLTKRPERAAAYFGSDDVSQRIVDAAFAGSGLDAPRGSKLRLLIGDGLSERMERERLGESSWPLSNGWIGVSVEDRKHGLPRIDALRQIPAAVPVPQCRAAPGGSWRDRLVRDLVGDCRVRERARSAADASRLGAISS